MAKSESRCMGEICGKTSSSRSAVAFTKSLQCEWTFIQRVMAETRFHFSPLRMAIQENFIPNLFGAQVDSLEADLIYKASRYGGMGLDLVETALPQFLASSE